IVVDGVFEIDANVAAHALFDGVADDEEGSGGQASRDGQQRDEKLCAKANFFHLEAFGHSVRSKKKEAPDGRIESCPTTKLQGFYSGGICGVCRNVDTATVLGASTGLSTTIRLRNASGSGDARAVRPAKRRRRARRFRTGRG